MSEEFDGYEYLTLTRAEYREIMRRMETDPVSAEEIAERILARVCAESESASTEDAVIDLNELPMDAKTYHRIVEMVMSRAPKPRTYGGQ